MTISRKIECMQALPRPTAKSLKNRPEPPPDGCEEPLLLWAVRLSDRPRFVHIGMLGAAEKGAACGCLCKSCGGAMIAVNVDKPASHFERPGTQRRHFKHHAQQPSDGCMASVARLLALELFVEQDTVELPARRRSISRPGLTQTAVQVLQEIEGEKVRVRSRTWIDQTSAWLVLEDGRKLLVTVRSDHSVDEQREASCVLSLKNVRDPAIASWDTQKILDHLRLPGSGIDWDRHWDDARLLAQQEADLSDQEDLVLGGIPREWLDGLTGKQASETVLHWLIKKTIAASATLRVPAHSVPVSQTMPDGSSAQDTAHCSEAWLEISNARLEQRLGDMVPDVLCNARRIEHGRAHGKPFELMIEAAVTHYIDDTKRQKILNAGMACLEIRADQFAFAGQVHARVIETLVHEEAGIKKWIVHPWIQGAIRQAQNRLAARARGMQKSIEEAAQKAQEREEAEKKRQADLRELGQWLRSTSESQLARSYVRALRDKWAQAQPRRWGSVAVGADLIWKELQRREIVTLYRERLEAGDGPLKALLEIRDHDGLPDTSGALNHLARAVRDNHSGYALILLAALTCYAPAFSEWESQRFYDLETQLRAAVDEGSYRVGRFTYHDRFLMLVFPEMREELQSGYGTSEHLTEMSEQRRQRQEASKVRERQRLQEELFARQQRELQVQEAFRRAINDKISAVAASLQWVAYLTDGPSAAVLYARHNAKSKVKSVESLAVFRAAIHQRDAGNSVAQTLQELTLASIEDVTAAVQLLREARLCSDSP